MESLSHLRKAIPPTRMFSQIKTIPAVQTIASGRLASPLTQPEDCFFRLMPAARSMLSYETSRPQEVVQVRLHQVVHLEPQVPPPPVVKVHRQLALPIAL